MKNTDIYKDEIENTYKKLYTASIHKDEDTLNEVLHPDYVLTHMTGMRQGKHEYIDAVLDGVLNYYSANHYDIDIELINESTAIVDGKSLVNAAVFGGGRYTWRLRQQLKLLRTNNGWQVISSKASTY